MSNHENLPQPDFFPIINVSSIDREPGRYLVESRTAVCEGPGQGKACRFECPAAVLDETHGEICPRCNGRLRRADPYLVDLNLYGGLGRCACRDWQFNIQKDVSSMSPERRFVARQTDEHRCSHLVAAMRFHALMEIDSRKEQNEGEAGGE